ncbi:41831_t:CDS:2 [Gigaspora margarita]|uniref:41831_t:CDS:1 n=1 Tax=Gigaspora margarita TaxID=4874 RepID=A0ABM8W1G1_GIGMA|nr:41831_t:CDS:2 [Gigaspora margarita]
MWSAIGTSIGALYDRQLETLANMLQDLQLDHYYAVRAMP